MSKELWADVAGYEGIYEISTKGRIRSWAYGTPRILKHGQHRNGYHFLKLYKNGFSTYYSVHRLVAKTFIPNPENKPQVNHKDGDVHNNTIENLEWCTSQENHIHAYRVLHRKGPNTGRTGAENWCSKPVAQLKDGIVIAVFCSATEAGKKTGSNITKISLVCNGKRKRTNGFEWKWN